MAGQAFDTLVAAAAPEFDGIALLADSTAARFDPSPRTPLLLLVLVLAVAVDTARGRFDTAFGARAATPVVAAARASRS